MANKIITRKSSDNAYFHPDFHIALNYGIDYLHKKFGNMAVKEYLTQFANNYHAILRKALIKNGLSAIKEHYEKIFKIEGADFDINFSSDVLIIHLSGSPAINHIKSNGHLVSPSFHETVKTVNKEICRDTPYDCEVLEYKHENGAYRLRFFKRIL